MHITKDLLIWHLQTRKNISFHRNWKGSPHRGKDIWRIVDFGKLESHQVWKDSHVWSSGKEKMHYFSCLKPKQKPFQNTYYIFLWQELLMYTGVKYIVYINGIKALLQNFKRTVGYRGVLINIVYHIKPSTTFTMYSLSEQHVITCTE